MAFLITTIKSTKHSIFYIFSSARFCTFKFPIIVSSNLVSTVMIKRLQMVLYQTLMLLNNRGELFAISNTIVYPQTIFGQRKKFRNEFFTHPPVKHLSGGDATDRAFLLVKIETGLWPTFDPWIIASFNAIRLRLIPGSSVRLPFN